MSDKKFSILITTKNRIADLKITLKSLSKLIENNNVECVICDDGSTDETTNYIKHYYPQIKLYSFNKSQGYLARRNFMLNNSIADFAISLDDDAYFLSENITETIEQYFNEQQNCALLAFRIYWGKNPPNETEEGTKSYAVNGFVGCGHAWRMSVWKEIPDYPEWFRFYGEELFMSYQLFKKGWQIIYTPNILVHHMVDLKARKKQKDFLKRQRYSLASGWFTMFLCYPKSKISKYFFSSLWSQVRRKTFKGNWLATIAVLQALFDLLVNSFRFFTNTYRLNNAQFKIYRELKETVIYWKPKIDNK